MQSHSAGPYPGLLAPPPAHYSCRGSRPESGEMDQSIWVQGVGRGAGVRARRTAKAGLGIQQLLHSLKAAERGRGRTSRLLGTVEGASCRLLI